MVRLEDETWWREVIGWERPTGVLLLGAHFGNWELLVVSARRVALSPPSRTQPEVDIARCRARKPSVCPARCRFCATSTSRASERAQPSE